ncbi:uncharacterized protein LY89DRAFT_692018 [Mollisia scopiformis]|uniref:Uncharacterized protein n=1 Tax=Mollisia scopiformis TaxID=149040 RepID=A0A132B3F1_MOLSC|nr:uncharacterized protein LY89DRAFT_692018 [Mollisia scopiformis]KUJ06926.1 hypothetical protein LY89DRAFT_692018 [Mollisia scopiformis]
MSLSIRDQLRQTARAYLDAHNNKDLDNIRALCDETCVHRNGPPTVKSPDRNNEEYIAFNAEVFKMLYTYLATIISEVVDEVTKTVALGLEAKATADAGVYENEYIITLKMTENGKKVVDQYDFIDSQRMIEWMNKMGDFAEKTWDKK